MWEHGCIFMSSPGDAGWCFWFQQREAEWSGYYGNKPIILLAAWVKEREREDRQRRGAAASERRKLKDSERMRRRETTEKQKMETKRHRRREIVWDSKRSKKNQKKTEKCGGWKVLKTEIIKSQTENNLSFFFFLCLSKKNNSVRFKYKNKKSLIMKHKYEIILPRWRFVLQQGVRLENKTLLLIKINYQTCHIIYINHELLNSVEPRNPISNKTLASVSSASLSMSSLWFLFLISTF